MISKFYKGYAENKNREELLKLYDIDKRQEYLKMAIPVRCVDALAEASENLSLSIKSIKDTIDKNSESANKLSSRLFWLNVLLTIITCIGVVFTIISTIKTI